MGQYHLTCNLDKKEFIAPHQLGDGLKLREQSQDGILRALHMLLACSNGRGGGDYAGVPCKQCKGKYHIDAARKPKGKWHKASATAYQGKYSWYCDECGSAGSTNGIVHADGTVELIIGRWAGDRIAVVGDYANADDLAEEHDAEHIYQRCRVAQSDEPETDDCGDNSARKITADGWRDISALVAPLLEANGGFKFTGTGWKHREYQHPEYAPHTNLCPDMVLSVPAQKEA